MDVESRGRIGRIGVDWRHAEEVEHAEIDVKALVALACKDLASRSGATGSRIGAPMS